ncbi:hypothetical protein [Mesorhizobium sp. WSM3866]|uniref:hypothetical protein n=1 Tax=Mesorhizobium sp. WSM3866 TaxID=422271 RepID=UPI001596C9E2|nr:hypothetical protein [Mesorhizobium sp. WSM3866]
MSIKHLWIIGALLLAAGCANHRTTYGNRDYTNTSFQGGGVNQDVFLPGNYVNPHSF